MLRIMYDPYSTPRKLCHPTNNPQLCEETHNPSTIVPRSIMFSIVINGATGLAMTIATLFCTKDLVKAATTPTGFPFMEIYLQATDNVAGATVMSSVILIMAVCATTGIVASSSRVFWSFARDRGLPGWKTLSKVRRCSTAALHPRVAVC